MKILYYNPTTMQKRFVPFEAIKGSAFFRRPNYDAMRLAYLSRGNDFYYYDERVEEKPDFSPDVVVVNVPFNLSRYIESSIRKMWRKAIIICHGFYPTLYPEHTSRFADTVVIGDIANIWHLILKDIAHKKYAPQYVSNRRDQFGVDRTLENKRGFTPLLSQIRTCFGCTCPQAHRDFCYENIMYPEPVRLNIDDVIKEVSRLKRKIIFIRDDDFLDDPHYAQTLLERCWPYKKMWLFQTHKRICDDVAAITRFRDHGVRIIWLKEDWLGNNLVSDVHNSEFLRNKKHEIIIIHNNRIAVGCQIRLGQEGEDFHFYQALLKFLIEIKVDLIKVEVQTPVPGTATYNRLMREKKITKDLSLYDRWMPVVHVNDVEPQALYSWMEWLRDGFYSWDSIVRRSVVVSPKLGVYNTMLFYVMPNLSYRDNFLEKVGYPP